MGDTRLLQGSLGFPFVWCKAGLEFNLDVVGTYNWVLYKYQYFSSPMSLQIAALQVWGSRVQGFRAEMIQS